MVSLTWVYVISLSIVSIGGMAAAFVGDRIHPIKGGDLGMPPPTPAQVATATASANELARRLRDASIEEKAGIKKVETPDLKQKIINILQINAETAQDITDFIKTPVVDWKKIASNEFDLDKKYDKVYDILQKLPPKFIHFYRLVDEKRSDMSDYILGRKYDNKGDETETALAILSSIEELDA